MTVICQDGEQIADALWSGNKRAGRSLRDVLDVVSNARAEIPPDEGAVALILADDEEFDEQLASLSARADRPVEERELAAAIASLVNPPPSDKTLIEVYRHLGWMSRALREATELAQRHDSLDAALAKHQNAPGARIIQVFVRTRPEQLASEAISTFEAARLRYDEDAARLEPYLRRHGLRTLKSVSGQNASGSATLIPPAKFAQKIRQSRHATRRLPDCSQACGRYCRNRSLTRSPRGRSRSARPIVRVPCVGSAHARRYGATRATVVICGNRVRRCALSAAAARKPCADGLGKNSAPTIQSGISGPPPRDRCRE